MNDGVTKEQFAIIDAFAKDARFIVSDAVQQMNWFRSCGGVPGNYDKSAENYEAKYGDSGDGWKAIMETDMEALNKAINRFCELNDVLQFPSCVVKEVFGFND